MKRLLILLSILVLVGCTITKRHSSQGYHIEWKRTFQSSNEEAKSKDLLPEEHPDFHSQQQPISENEDLKDSTQAAEANSSRNQPETQKEKRNIQKTDQKLDPEPVKTGEVPNESIGDKQEEKKVEVLTWYALGIIVLGIILALISFLLATPEIIWALLAGLCILVIILSTISVVRIHRNPDRYKAKGLSWTIFGLSIIPFAAALITLVYLVLLLTNNIDL